MAKMKGKNIRPAARQSGLRLIKLFDLQLQVWKGTCVYIMDSKKEMLNHMGVQRPGFLYNNGSSHKKELHPFRHRLVSFPEGQGVKPSK